MAPAILNRRRFFKAGTATAIGSGLPVASISQTKDPGRTDLDEDWAIGPPWGHLGNPSMEEQKGYSKLFGEEKGELRPDRTYG